MKFSLWNFKEWYERRKRDLSYMISDNTASISLLATSQAAAEGRLGCALVLPAEELTDCTGFHTVLQFGSDRILFPVASPAEVLNEGAAMMEFYTHWENALLDRIPANGAVPDFIQLSREVLPFPLALLSANGAVLFQSADWPLALGPQQIQSLFRKNPQRNPHSPTSVRCHTSSPAPSWPKCSTSRKSQFCWPPVKTASGFSLGMSIFSIHLPKSFKPLSRFVRMRCPPYTPCLPGFPDSSPSRMSSPLPVYWHKSDGT